MPQRSFGNFYQLSAATAPHPSARLLGRTSLLAHGILPHLEESGLNRRHPCVECFLPRVSIGIGIGHLFAAGIIRHGVASKATTQRSALPHNRFGKPLAARSRTGLRCVIAFLLGSRALAVVPSRPAVAADWNSTSAVRVVRAESHSDSNRADTIRPRRVLIRAVPGSCPLVAEIRSAITAARSSYRSALRRPYNLSVLPGCGLHSEKCVTRIALIGHPFHA